jgi:hypothetical protein
MALEGGHSEKGLAAVTETLKKVKTLVAQLLSDLDEGQLPGGLIRSVPATVSDEDAVS